MSESLAFPVDVTDELRAAGHLTGEDFNPQDRVFAVGDVRVKVKTEYVDHRMPLPMDVVGRPLAHIVRVYHFSGSEVGDEGKALRTVDGAPRIWAFGDHLTVHPYAQTDVAGLIADKQRICAWQSAVAAENAALADSLPGVAARALPPPTPVLQLAAPSVALAAPEPPAVTPAIEATIDAALLAEPVEDLADPATPARHSSGRRFVVHPGYVTPAGSHAAAFVEAQDLAALYGLTPAQYVLFKPDRPADYYVGLTPLYPRSDGAYPDLGADPDAAV